MASFHKVFIEVQPFGGGVLVLSREHYDRAEAAAQMSDYEDYAVDPEALEEDWVRWQFPPPEVDMDYEGPCWVTGAKAGPGAKRVWVYDRKELEQ